VGLAEWSTISPSGKQNGQLAYNNWKEHSTERLRAAARRGRPWGDDSLVREIS